VCFKELDDAVRAKEELNGYAFLNRTLVIQFAKGKRSKP
jgi:RNA recognition motif-containing protein